MGLVTWNSADKSYSIALDSTLRNATAMYATGEYAARATLSRGASGGKWYFEVLLGADCSSARSFQIGLMPAAASLASGAGKSTGCTAYDLRGYKYLAGSPIAISPSATQGDVIGVAWDSGSGKVWWAKNNTWMQSGNPGTGAAPMYTNSALVSTLYPAISFYGPHAVAGSSTMIGRWHGGEFSYSPPSGFSAWGPSPVAKSSHVTVSGGGYGDKVVFMDASTFSPVVTATPASPDGAWSASVPPGDYYVLYLKSGKAPLCHGPYTIS